MAASWQSTDWLKLSISLADLPAPWFYALVREQLGPEDRLRLFQTCPSLAYSVQQHAARTQLTFDGDYPDSSSTCSNTSHGGDDSSSSCCSNSACSNTSGCSGDSSSRSSSCSNSNSACSNTTGCGDDSNNCCSKSKQQQQQHQQQQVARFKALQRLAGSAADLHVVLRKHVPAILSSLPADSITHLTLSGVSLNTKVMQHGLQLGRCKRLRSLTLDANTCSQFTLQEVSAMSKDVTTVLPLSLTHLELGETCDCGIMQLLAPQLRQLDTSARWEGSRRQLVSSLCTASFCKLQRISITWYLTDTLLDALLRLPSLERVTTGTVNLQYDHSQASCRWQCLEVRRGASVDELARLPLQRIKQVIIHKHLCCPVQQEHATMQLSAMQQVAACHNILFIPASDPLALAALGTPVFELSGDYNQEMVLLCARGLGSSPVALRCSGFELSAGLALLPCLQLLPPSIKVLWFSFARQPGHMRQAIPPVQEDCLQQWQQLVAQLPASIKQLVLHHPTSTEEVCRPNAAALAKALDEAQHPALLTVLHSRYLGADPRLDVLAAEHAGKVRVLCANIS